MFDSTLDFVLDEHTEPVPIAPAAPLPEYEALLDAYSTAITNVVDRVGPTVSGTAAMRRAPAPARASSWRPTASC